MQDMVFQGTVWRPPFWNVSYADARHAIQAAGFEDAVHALDARNRIRRAVSYAQRCSPVRY